MRAQTRSTPRQGGPFGVCAAIGADFGFNPDILRVVLAAGLLWNLPAIVAIYAFAALVMIAGRALFPVAVMAPDVTPSCETVRIRTASDDRRHAEAETTVPERLAA